MFLSKRMKCDKYSLLLAVLWGGSMYVWVGEESALYLVLQFSKAEPKTWMECIGLLHGDISRLTEEQKERHRARAKPRGSAIRHRDSLLQDSCGEPKVKNSSIQSLGRTKNYAATCLICVPFGWRSPWCFLTAENSGWTQEVHAIIGLTEATGRMLEVPVRPRNRVCVLTLLPSAWRLGCWVKGKIEIGLKVRYIRCHMFCFCFLDNSLTMQSFSCNFSKPAMN